MMIDNEYLSDIEMNNLQNCTLDGKFLTISDSDEEVVIWSGKYSSIYFYKKLQKKKKIFEYIG